MAIAASAEEGAQSRNRVSGHLEHIFSGQFLPGKARRAGGNQRQADHLGPRLPRHTVGPGLLDSVASDEPGGNGVHACRGELERRGLRAGYDTTLCGVVVAVLPGGLKTLDTCDVHDAAAGTYARRSVCEPGFHPGRYLLRAEEYAAEVRVHHLVPLLGGHFLKRRQRIDAGVVHQDRDRAELRLDIGNQRPDSIGVGDVGLHRQGPAAVTLDFPRDRCGAGLPVAEMHRNIRTGLAETVRILPPLCSTQSKPPART
jgi:hypothetical protein